MDGRLRTGTLQNFSPGLAPKTSGAENRHFSNLTWNRKRSESDSFIFRFDLKTCVFFHVLSLSLSLSLPLSLSLSLSLSLYLSLSLSLSLSLAIHIYIYPSKPQIEPQTPEPRKPMHYRHVWGWFRAQSWIEPQIEPHLPRTVKTTLRIDFWGCAYEASNRTSNAWAQKTFEFSTCLRFRAKSWIEPQIEPHRPRTVKTRLRIGFEAVHTKPQIEPQTPEPRKRKSFLHVWGSGPNHESNLKSNLNVLAQ